MKGRVHIKDIIKNQIRGSILPSTRQQTPRDLDENTMTNMETAEQSEIINRSKLEEAPNTSQMNEASFCFLDSTEPSTELVKDAFPVG